MRKAFEGKEYGFFFHFLSPFDGKGRTDEWNAYVDKLNLKKMAAQLHELKAGYAFITVGQNSGYYCTPNSVYDREVGPGWCSKRDIIAEFADELAVYGIDCYVYSTSLPAYRCEDAMVKLQAVPPWDSSMHCRPWNEVKQFAVSDPRLKHCQTVWNEIHTEWAKRWGTHIKGWWIDGSYFPEKMYDFPDEPNGHTFCRALRAGNPDAVVAFNPGVVYPPRRNYPGSDEDYTAGETNDVYMLLHNGKYLDNLRYQILTYAGQKMFGWASKPIKPAETLASYTRDIVDHGGVITWDLPFGLDGIAEEEMVILRDFVRRYEESKKIFPKCNLSVVPPTKEDAGSVSILSEEEMTVNVKWNGKTTPVKVPGTMTLPFTGYGGKSTVEIERGGFTRRLTFCGVPYELSFPLEHKTEYCQMKAFRDGNSIRFHLDIRENTPVDGPVFWKSSCTELLFVVEDGSTRQYAVDYKGEFFEYADGKKCPLPGMKYEKTAEGYSVDFPLPCPEGKSFRFEIYSHVGIDGELVSSSLFGSEVGMWRIPQFATVFL